MNPFDHMATVPIGDTSFALCGHRSFLARLACGETEQNQRDRS
jgi:hypothetical protein